MGEYFFATEIKEPLKTLGLVYNVAFSKPKAMGAFSNTNVVQILRFEIYLFPIVCFERKSRHIFLLCMRQLVRGLENSRSGYLNVF